MAWCIALASGWSMQPAYGDEADESQLASARTERTATDRRDAADMANPWGVQGEAERQARAIADREGAGSHGTTQGTTSGTDVRLRALSTLALHAARAMGSDNARVIGLDVIEPPIAVSEGGTGIIRPAAFGPAVPRGASADGRRGRDDGSRRGVRHADLASFRPPRHLASAYDDMIEQVAREHAVEPHLVRAVIKVESNFEPNARSPKGAIGLMQVMPATGRRFGASDLKDPRANLGAGTRYLRWLLNRFDEDLTLAVAAYNAGEGAVEKYGRQVPPYPETRNYVRKVLAHLGMAGAGRDASGNAPSDTTADAGAEAGADSGRDANGAQPARRPSRVPARAVAGSVSRDGTDATLRRLSGWFGAILTSGSTPATRGRGGEVAQYTAGRGTDPVDPWNPDEWTDEERDRDKGRRNGRGGRSDARPDARSYTADWPVSDRDDTASREPV